MKKSDFYYNLPQEFIAQTPIEPRDSSRMMVVDKKSGKIEHKQRHQQCQNRLKDGIAHIGIRQAVQKLRADGCADNGRYTVEDRHEDHKEKHPRAGFPDQCIHIKQPFEEIRCHALDVGGDFLQGFRFRAAIGIIQIAFSVMKSQNGHLSVPAKCLL